MPHAASMPPSPHVFQLLHFSAQCPATPPTASPFDTSAHPPTYPASALFRCSPGNPVASVLICASPAFVIFLLRFLPSCFCSTRVFTQIHCFNLLKFVDRKQKLINAWARNGWLSGSVVWWFLAGLSEVSEVTEQLHVVPHWKWVRKTPNECHSVYFF